MTVIYPSSTALPKGRVELEPPRKVFHIVSAKVCAWESEVKPTAPEAPPRLSTLIKEIFVDIGARTYLIVTILPAA